MKKEQLIKQILSESKIHHNIRIQFTKMPDYGDGELDWENISGDLQNDFVENFQYEKINDSGNRNLCSCKRILCTKKDFKTGEAKKLYSGRVYIADGIGWKNYKEAKKVGLVDSPTGKYTTDGACKTHDLWHVYSYGRMGATLYWDKYWDGVNSGFGFKYNESDLEEMSTDELVKILKEISYFNDKIKELMKDFYAECEYRLKENRKEKIQEEKDEKDYQKTKNQVIKGSYIKRLVSEIL